MTLESFVGVAPRPNNLHFITLSYLMNALMNAARILNMIKTRFRHRAEGGYVPQYLRRLWRGCSRFSILSDGCPGIFHSRQIGNVFEILRPAMLENRTYLGTLTAEPRVAFLSKALAGAHKKRTFLGAVCFLRFVDQEHANKDAFGYIVALWKGSLSAS